jgi:hypothetical protein
MISPMACRRSSLRWHLPFWLVYRTVGFCSFPDESREESGMSERNNQYDDEYEWLETRSQKGRVKKEKLREEAIFFREGPARLFRKVGNMRKEKETDHHKNDDRDT